MDMKISIPESVFMISLDDEEGKVLLKVDKRLPYVLHAAAVCELALMGHLSFTANQIKLSPTKGTANRVLDHVFRTLAQAPREILHAIQFLASHEKDIKEEVVEMLITRGIIERKEQHLFWLPVDIRMKNTNYTFERDIRKELKHILTHQQETTPRHTILFTLLVSVGVLEEIFPRQDDLIDAMKVAKDLLAKSQMNEGLREVLHTLRDFLLRHK